MTEYAEIRRLMMERGGIINVNKPAGLTSHDVVGRVRRLLSVKKVGHTGTLDPMATGVLPVCVGRATRVMEYLDMDRKTYTCTMRLGRSYDTQDITGEVVHEVPEAAVNAVSEAQVQAAFSGFRGVVEQLPPMYSAIKVGGRKLYEYARAGRTAEVMDKVRTRRIYIWDLKIGSMQLGCGYDSEVTFTVVCSKGTYIRSICEEAGRLLGTGAAMASLVRGGSGGFVLEEAVSLSDLSEMTVPEIWGCMSAPEDALGACGEIRLSGSMDIRRITNGLPVWTKHAQVIRMPLYASGGFPLPVGDSLQRAYLAFAEPEHVFLGIVTMDADGENVRADKIFADGVEILARREERESESF